MRSRKTCSIAGFVKKNKREKTYCVQLELKCNSKGKSERSFRCGKGRMPREKQEFIYEESCIYTEARAHINGTIAITITTTTTTTATTPTI